MLFITGAGRFAPPGIEVLDPKMRRSTEFPQWVDDNIAKLKVPKSLFRRPMPNLFWPKPWILASG